MEMFDPAHPGEVLRKYLPEGMTVKEAAKRLGVTRQALSALLNGRSGVSAEMALRLEAALDTKADFWLRLQMHTGSRAGGRRRWEILHRERFRLIPRTVQGGTCGLWPNRIRDRDWDGGSRFRRVSRPTISLARMSPTMPPLSPVQRKTTTLSTSP